MLSWVGNCRMRVPWGWRSGGIAGVSFIVGRLRTAFVFHIVGVSIAVVLFIIRVRIPTVVLSVTRVSIIIPITFTGPIFPISSSINHLIRRRPLPTSISFSRII
jgi:hypothetical protein